MSRKVERTIITSPTKLELTIITTTPERSKIVYRHVTRLSDIVSYTKLCELIPLMVVDISAFILCQICFVL